MQTYFKTTLLLTLLTLFAGCYGYRAYLGLHGKSIRTYPEIHELSIKEDYQCLECHHPDNADEAQPTPHPDFTGCLKCHNDEL